MVTVDGRPRPQLWRTGAESLDGDWDFAPDPQGRWDHPEAVEWSTTIRVPFAPGTPASGVAEGDPGLAWWYRRTARFVDGPAEQILHFGAVDHVADVIAIVECPRRSETTLGWIPAANASEAQVWRRSWGPLSGGRPLALTNRLNRRVTESG